MLCIVYTLMSCTQLGNCKCLHLLLPRLLPLLPLLLPLRPLRLPRLLLSPHLRCLPRMCCCLLLVLCLLPSPLLHLPDAGWFQRLQRANASAAAKRKAKLARRRQQKKPKQKARQRNQMAALVGKKRQR
jgi:hypothetical protein